jgi:tetratricopeptide (TPR) repeat protein
MVRFAPTHSRWPQGWLLSTIILGLAMSGCASQRNAAITKLDAAWKELNDQTLEREGRRRFDVTRDQAFVAAQASLRRLGMVVEQQDLQTGFLFVTAPAPVPLTGAEWASVQESDLPKMRAILREDLGVLSDFAKLDPSNRDILANVFVADKDDAVEVSLNFRIRDRNPSSGRAQRMQAPPTAVGIGVRKFWSTFEEELRAVTRAAPQSPGPGRTLAPPDTRALAQPGGSRSGTAELVRAEELALQATGALRNGQYATALPIAQEALAIRERVLGPSSVDVASSLNTLGEIYRGQGRFDDAERLHRRALAIQEKELGPDNPDVAESLTSLAMLRNAQGSFIEAEALLKRALLILENAVEKGKQNYRLEGEVLEDLAKVYRAQGRNAEADEALARAALMWRLQ